MLQPLPVPGPFVFHRRPAVIDPSHATVPPVGGGVVQLFLRVDRVDQDGRPVRSRPAHDNALGIEDEASPGLAPGAIVGAHGEVVAAGRSL